MATPWRSEVNPMFRSHFSESTFNEKYRHEGCETWADLASVLVEDVCAEYLTESERAHLTAAIRELKFIPGGRYLYYAGRDAKFYNNCFLLKAEEDTREDWANLSWKSESCLMTGGGIGADYSVYRAEGTPLGRTGGTASGPTPKMEMTNEIGRKVKQGGSRRSAIYASLRWSHGDIFTFLKAKDWHNMEVKGTNGLTVWDLKAADPNYPAPLDMTNISVNYDTSWLMNLWKTQDPGDVFRQNIEQAMQTGEPGFSFNFFDQENETLRNACTEVTSEDDSDVCNLGTLNLGRIESMAELKDIIDLAILFLMCGTFKAHVPYKKVMDVREKNRRLGLGLMGVHEWLLKRGYRYEVPEELRQWMTIYKRQSTVQARAAANRFSCSEPIATRAIAPTGTIGILAGTTTGIEPLFSVAYKRRFLKGNEWHYQYVIDGAAQELIDVYGANPDRVESAMDLAEDVGRRLEFQADIQEYVDQSIASTINLPPWGSENNNPDRIDEFAGLVSKYAHRLRGLTFFPDGSRGLQPLTRVPYSVAKAKVGQEFKDGQEATVVETHDICSLSGRGGVCGA